MACSNKVKSADIVTFASFGALFFFGGISIWIYFTTKEMIGGELKEKQKQ